MLIYLVRHGESLGNRDRVHQDSKTKLTSDGIKQAELVAERLSKIPIDLIYASPHKRTTQTAEIISKKINKPIEFWNAIKEVIPPSETISRLYDDPESIKIYEQIHKNYIKGNWKYSDEETFEELNTRAEKVLQHLLTEHSEQNVLCVSHGIFIKMMAAIVSLGDSLTAENFLHFKHHTYSQNTGITIIEHTEKYGWSLNSWNDTNHL